MDISRRELFAAGALAGAAFCIDSAASAAPAGSKAVLRVASQEGLIPGDDLPAKLATMEKWDIDGIEIGGRGLSGRVPEIKSALANSKVKMSAVCAGFDGALASHDEAERAKARTSMMEILEAAGELGSTGLIFVPAFNGQTNLNHVDARKVLVDQLPALGEHAVKCGTRLLLEPLNRGETWLVRLLSDAAAICRDVKSPGVAVMGDFYHMGIEEPNDMGAFLSARDYLHHVHLASVRRKLPGQDERDYTDGFRALKMIGYTDFCSFECGVEGERTVEIPKSVRFLRDQWSKAKV